jgi:prolyl 4-hydroxylase
VVPNGGRSELTLMAYLNEGYGGGETVFYTPAGVERFRVSPTKGMALIFPHAEYHEGAALSSGRKYVLRTDVMFSQSRRFVLD